MRSAEKDLGRLSPDVARRILDDLEELKRDPRPAGVRPLHGNRLPGFRLVVGDYRVLYTVDDQAEAITVYAVGHRSEVYRKK
ncbi:MAG: type II toxin-antitoxin system RelE/ParE family toxin [Planctomycetota bacterium]